MPTSRCITPSKAAATATSFFQRRHEPAHCRTYLDGKQPEAGARAGRLFFLEYQPEIDIASGRIIGAEALLRWRHPELGLLSPARFIPIADDCGLANAIGNWVLTTACRQARVWLDDGMPMVVSVNMSVSQLRQKKTCCKA
ncbi:EAL domain-containing protein [Undibacterium arcticum]